MRRIAKPKSKTSTLTFILQLIVIFVIVVLGVSIYRQVFFEKVNVIGRSMQPTINEQNSYVTILKNGYKIERGDIVVFFRPESEEYSVEDNPANQKLTFNEFMMNTIDMFKREFVGIPSADEESSDIIQTPGYRCIIKRVIGIPGDKIKIKDGELYVNDVLQEEDYILEDMKEQTLLNQGVKDGEWTVGEDELFVLGDNRNNSTDSEDYGCIKKIQVKGKAVILHQDGKNTIL